MTEQQLKRIYFPTWRETFAAAWEKTSSGRIQCRPGRPYSEAQELVAAHAQSFAEPEARGVTEADMRHAATALALQRARSWRAGTEQPLPTTPDAASSRHLDGVSLDMFRALCALVVDPTWLGTVERPGLLWWENPEESEKQRMLYLLNERTTPGYAAKLCADMYGTRDYCRLRYEDLRHLYRLVRDRVGAWRPRVRQGVAA